ncbi:MAG TPA: AcrB/AcrD/AcrF family protein [Spirochaetia bacterium]|nr:AcrB/AcrD/AcrF family protein [Spirochaetia bacterium]
MKRIIEYFAKNRMAVFIIVVMIILFGIVRLFTLKQEVTPSAEFNRLIINVSYPGASPVDIENDVILPLEEKLKAITGIDTYTATIVENTAMMMVELEESLSDTRTVKDEIFRKMNNTAGLPSDAEITVIEMNPKLMSVYTIGIRVKENKTATTKELYNYAEALHDDLLKKVNEVAEINMNGYQDPEIHIYVNPEKMNKYYISFDDIVNSIRNRNLRSTGGTLKEEGSESTIITIGEFKKVSDAQSVIIRSSYDNKRIFIKDIAAIEDSFEESSVLVRVNKTPSVILSFVKKENADVIKTIEAVKNYLKKNQGSVPVNLEINEIQDNSQSIRALVGVVKSNALLGIILIFISLVIFLDKRSAIWVAFGIVITVLGTIIYMSGTDISFNMISLAAMVTILGMIVDNGIVVSENIYSYRLKGIPALEAASRGVVEVLGPISSSTFTTVAAFFPILMIGGMMGKFIRQFPLIVISSLLISILQAVLILPNQIYNSSVKRTNIKTAGKDWYNKMAEGFANILRSFMKRRYIVLSFFIFLLVLTMFISMQSMRGFRLMPSNASDTIRIKLEAPEKTSLETTSARTLAVENAVMDIVQSNELMAEQTMIGKQLQGRDMGAEIHPNWAQVTVYLVPVTERKRTAKEIITAIRQEIEKRNIKGFTSIVVEEVQFGPDAGKAIEVKLAGKNSDVLKKAGDDVKQFLSTIDGVVSIDDDLNFGKEEIIIGFKYDVMSRYNLNVAAVAQTVRSAYAGSIASSILRDGDTVNFRVQLAPEYTRDLKVLENLLVPNTTGRLIHLKEAAAITRQVNAGTIRHTDGDRTITIEADLKPGNRITPQMVMREIMKKYRDINKNYPGVSLLFGGEIEETSKSLKQIGIAFLIALLAIYLVLILQFNHIIQPFIVLSIIPFGLIGAVFAFKLHGMTLSFMGIIGIIGLSGVVVNNGIIMVDLINRIIGENKNSTKEEIFEEIITGAKLRLRPILLTSITTIVGLLPTVYGIGGSSDMVTPIVTALAYGLMFTTLLTLVLLPCILMIAVDLGLLKFSQK